MKPYAEQQKRTLFISVALFVFFAAAIILFGYRSYFNFEAQSRAETEARLAAIASVKLQGLSDWRANLLDAANLIYQNPAFSDLTTQYFLDPQDSLLRGQILHWLEAYKKNREFPSVYLLDARQRVMLATEEDVFLGLAVLRETSQAAQSGAVSIADFHQGADGQVYLALVIPILKDGQAEGFVVLRVDPAARLYPLLARQGSSDTQVQSFLVRRDGSSAVFLNPLKFEPDAALRLRTPLGEEESLAVKAAQGQTGILEGLDYRGVEMVADVQAVPNSPWVLVTQLAASEVYAPVSQNFGRTVIVTGTVIFYLGLGAVLIWRQRQLKYYQSEAAAAEALRKTQEDLLLLTRALDEKVRERTAELQDVNRQLHALSQQMVGMQEQQIKNLAAELHDRIGQNLTAININLSLVNQLLPKNSSAQIRARLADTTHLVEETVARMRNVVAEFLPPMLERYGLPPALIWYGEQFEARTNIRVQVHDARRAAARLSPDVEIGLFRIIQEALNNVAKHARASEVHIEMTDEDGVTLAIADNGVGFDARAVSAQPQHWGIAMMRERANALGAALEISSSLGAGAKIILRIPT